jgi:hypothetical protein
MRVLLLCCLVFIAIVGCATPRYHNTVMDIGPKPINYEQTIREQMRVTLLDPHSVQDFRAWEPISSSCMIGPGYPFYGWRVATQYNAKNAYGGYTGIQWRYYWFHGEQIKLVTSSSVRCPEGW